jgi:hypothetical protein
MFFICHTRLGVGPFSTFSGGNEPEDFLELIAEDARVQTDSRIFPLLYLFYEVPVDWHVALQ